VIIRVVDSCARVALPRRRYHTTHHVRTLPADRPLGFQLHHYNVIEPTQSADRTERYYRLAQVGARELPQARKSKRHACSGPESPSFFGTNLGPSSLRRRNSDLSVLLEGEIPSC